jgi:hypothetical protein
VLKYATSWPIRNKEALSKVFKLYKPDVVFHAAAYKHAVDGRPVAGHSDNIEGTKNLADLACEHNVVKFVMVSTDKAVNPSNVMGASKRIAENMFNPAIKSKENEIKATKFITTRFEMFWVPMVLWCLCLANKQGAIHDYASDIIRYFDHSEACQLVLKRERWVMEVKSIF